MTKARLVIILIAAALVVGAIVIAVFAFANAGKHQSTPAAEPAASATVTQTTPRPTATPEVVATCENTSTTKFHALMSVNGWTPKNTLSRTEPEPFLGDLPTGSIRCTWQADHSVGTDWVATLLWAPLSGATAQRAQEKLAAEGFERIDAPEGTYFALRGRPEEAQFLDDEGFGATYLFTETDVRVASTKEDAGYIKGPAQDG